jgi:hypothetical protein
LDRGTRPDYAVSVINSKVFEDYVVGNGKLIPSSQKFPFVPAPTLEMVGGSSNTPTQMKFTFNPVILEWFRYTWKARLRSGNVVLIDELYWHWDTQNLNLIHLWDFQVDLASKTVGFYDWKAAGAGVPSKVHPTTLSVSIDDSSGDSMRLFPGLWW